MIRGDISNKQSPILAFNLDNLLFTEKKEGLFNSIIKTFSSEKTKFLDRPTNKDLKRDLELLWDKYNFSIYLVSFQPDSYELELLDKLAQENFCFTRIEFLESKEELRENMNRYTYYFDTDESLLSFMSSNGAVHYNQLWKKVMA
jgi:hypothetical protein